MTLDEAIEHAEWCAGEAWGECAEEHEQLAEWLRELKRARMQIDLLKILRDGFKADAQKYKDENARMRELCKRVLKNCYDAYEQVWGWDDDWVILCDEARKLGIEVE